MVFTGKPSTGCLNCRKAKKQCDYEKPTCSRCERLGRTCGGYRDPSDLMFRDENSRVVRRHNNMNTLDHRSAPSSSHTPLTVTREASPDREDEARAFFFASLITPTFLPYLEDMPLDGFLNLPVVACGLAALANRENDVKGKEMARRYYVRTITATNLALRNVSRTKEDQTLIAVALLGLFERLMWEPGHPSLQPWLQHVNGSANIIRLRGSEQLQTERGLAIFRDLRAHILVESLGIEQDVPQHIIEWTQTLKHDKMHSPWDELTLLGARLTSIRAAFYKDEKDCHELTELCSVLETDLVKWSEKTIHESSNLGFFVIQDPLSSSSWNGVRHDYASPHAFRVWNLWRALRVLLSRVQEAVWRELMASESDQVENLPLTEYYNDIRNRMANEFCIAIAYSIGSQSSDELPRGSVANAFQLMMPLLLSGICLLEQLGQPSTTPGGSRIILVNEPLHLDPSNGLSIQLAWIVGRLDYLAGKVGLGWAASVSAFLKGERKVYYDLNRMRVLGDPRSIKSPPAKQSPELKHYVVYS